MWLPIPQISDNRNLIKKSSLVPEYWCTGFESAFSFGEKFGSFVFAKAVFFLPAFKLISFLKEHLLASPFPIFSTNFSFILSFDFFSQSPFLTFFSFPLPTYLYFLQFLRLSSFLSYPLFLSAYLVYLLILLLFPFSLSFFFFLLLENLSLFLCFFLCFFLLIFVFYLSIYLSIYLPLCFSFSLFFSSVLST